MRSCEKKSGVFSWGGGNKPSPYPQNKFSFSAEPAYGVYQIAFSLVPTRVCQTTSESWQATSEGTSVQGPEVQERRRTKKTQNDGKSYLV